MEHTILIGDWIKPKQGHLPAPGMWIGRVVAKAVYGGRLSIPAYVVAMPGTAKQALVVADEMEYWFTPSGDEGVTP